jgi:hypothetical protein
MLALAHMLDFLMHKFSRRRRRRLAFPQVLSGLFCRRWIWHSAPLPESDGRTAPLVRSLLAFVSS